LQQSYKDRNGKSLNDALHVGASLQRELFAVCLRFPIYQYVFSTDIAKMFRQVWVAAKHGNYQRIIRREDPEEQLDQYRICTVTYGMACAQFLGSRVHIRAS